MVFDFVIYYNTPLSITHSRCCYLFGLVNIFIWTYSEHVIYQISHCNIMLASLHTLYAKSCLNMYVSAGMHAHMRTDTHTRIHLQSTEWIVNPCKLYLCSHYICFYTCMLSLLIMLLTTILEYTLQWYLYGVSHSRIHCISSAINFVVQIYAPFLFTSHASYTTCK